MQQSVENTHSKLLQDLNASQRSAVEFCDGPSLVIAGAGSGKTRVLTYKIAYLLEQGLPPYHILALTFTNKAAREMKERIAQLVGEKDAFKLWMGTFHSIFARILRYEAELLGFTSNFTIFDSSDSGNLLKLIIKELNLDDKVYRPGSVHNQISKAKNSLITPAMYRGNKEIIEYDQSSKRPLIYEIYERYQNRLKSANSMDFDDLLLYPNILFRDHPDVLDKYRNRFQYILVDEYQDTNFAQHHIVQQLAAIQKRVCVVGDDAQSIYSFRGANIDNILKFKSNFHGAKIFKLEQNYRSTQNIVNAANSLIKKNTEQIFKDVFSEKEVGDKIELVSAFSDFEEGLIVANKISRLRYDNHASYGEMAILYRTNAQSRIFEESLRKNNIPYRIYGGLSFYQRKEIKDIVSYFRMIVNPNDEIAFRRTVNFPTRGIGDVTVGKIAAAASQYENTTLWDVISDPSKYDLNLNAGVLKKIAGFQTLINGFITNKDSLSAFDLAQNVVKETGIASEAYSDMTPEGMSRAQNIQELLNAMNEFVAIRTEQGEENVSLIDFLSEVSLLSDQDADNESSDDKVTLMTVHSAKGLEFDHVFVVGLEEDLFPSMMARDIRSIEEERRLFYVAITRARMTCTLSFAKSRFKNGQVGSTRESRFLNDIDPGYISMDRGVLSSPRNESSEGFWNSFREKQSAPSQVKTGISSFPKKVTLIQQTTSSIDLSNEAKELQEGNIIEHERFGRGVVQSIEMSGNDRRAFVEFESAGRKQLLLKFAKFKIVQ